MDEVLFDRHTILELLEEVAARLAEVDHPRAELIVVGGSFMALKGLRTGTADVDTVTRLDRVITAAVAEVAARRELRSDWLNDRAAPFAPAGLSSDECEVLFDHGRLVALGPPPDAVFLMKLQAARAGDADDMRALWPTCSFADPAQAVAAFYEAYPHEELDPHLLEFVSRTVGAG